MVSTTAADKFSRPSVINPPAFLPLREFKKKKESGKEAHRWKEDNQETLTLIYTRSSGSSRAYD